MAGEPGDGLLDDLVDLGGKALDGAADIVESGLNAVGEGAEDAGEMVKLHDAFGEIIAVRLALEQEKDAINIGMTDVLTTAGRQQAIATVRELQQTLGRLPPAFSQIGQSKLRFSADFLGKEIAELQQKLDDLRGWAAGFLHHIVSKLKDEQSMAGTVYSILLTPETTRQLYDLSLGLKGLEGVLSETQAAMQGVIDPRLKTPSNNMLLNPLLNAGRKAERAKKGYDRYRQIMDTIDSLKGKSK